MKATDAKAVGLGETVTTIDPAIAPVERLVAKPWYSQLYVQVLVAI